MGTEERTKALRDLSAVSGTRFILCSLKAAGVGINLTRANVCFMMDPWWNASTENQAIDRVHRYVLVVLLYVCNFTSSRYYDYRTHSNFCLSVFDVNI